MITKLQGIDIDPNSEFVQLCAFKYSPTRSTSCALTPEVARLLLLRNSYRDPSANHELLV